MTNDSSSTTTIRTYQYLFVFHLYLGLLYTTLCNGLLRNFGISEFQPPARLASSSVSVPQFCVTGAVYCQQLKNVTNYVRHYT